MTTKPNKSWFFKSVKMRSKSSILTVTIVNYNASSPSRLHLWVVSGGHLCNVWSHSSRWQRLIHTHPTMTCSHRALSFVKIPENMSDRTLLLLWYASLASQCRPLPGVWCMICSSCVLAHKIQTRLNVTQPASLSFAASGPVSDQWWRKYSDSPLQENF